MPLIRPTLIVPSLAVTLADVYMTGGCILCRVENTDLWLRSLQVVIKVKNNNFTVVLYRRMLEWTITKSLHSDSFATLIRSSCLKILEVFVNDVLLCPSHSAWHLETTVPTLNISLHIAVRRTKFCQQRPYSSTEQQPWLQRLVSRHSSVVWHFRLPSDGLWRSDPNIFKI